MSSSSTAAETGSSSAASSVSNGAAAASEAPMTNTCSSAGRLSRTGRTSSSRFWSTTSTRAGVGETELELLGLPPRVERHRDGAEERAGPEHDHPFGCVGRDDRDAVTADHADRLESARAAPGGLVVLAERQPALPLHEPGQIGARRALRHHLAEGMHALAVHLGRLAQHGLDDDLEGPSGPRELGDDGIRLAHPPILTVRRRFRASGPTISAQVG